ncbi:S41 family peptidase [Algoriphagus sp. D3-2-R+10]|uniref:S41 family peptidase n=1 Tax=Algoriphagus aurantiacus TaxID=3103948 RepID=UPI002B3D33C6|nr:S41 family peptidase [Algoriphagus sp. D3-2-R+10]MEB2778633.1 S41 family peptidase [Algoriphagus sp. D3-2-R+10]
MKKSILTFLYLVFATAAYCQTKETDSKLNFGFENALIEQPVGWENFGSSEYIISLDSITTKSGKYAASIEFNEGNPEFKAWSFTLPDNYAGKKITLTGYIKTENVTDGYAGLWMRIDPSIAFDNMNQNGVQGTTDWSKYEITLGMNPEKTKQIVVGGLLVGKGKMWIDDLQVSIDGENIENLKPIEKKIYPADTDKEFDNGSLIPSISADKNQIENLKTLGLIWGYLKYYHPTVANGEYNWDYELFRILPQVLNSENKESRDEILVKWIENIGQFSEGEGTIIQSTEVKIEPDLDWIENYGFSGELTTLLLKVKNAARPNEHYYIGLQPYVGNPEFKNENSYSSMKYPDAGFRMLSLYRYWNIIQYYFPYKNLIEEEWENVLEEFVPKFLAAKNETDYTLAVLELIGRVNDTHANIWGNNQILINHYGLRYAPVDLTFIEGKAVVTGYYDEKLGKETGLEIGDVITAINSRPVEEIVNEKLKYSPASNYTTKLRDIAPKLLRTNDSTINVEIARNDRKESKSLKTFSSNEINIYSKYSVSDTSFKMINNEIAYINNGSLKREHLSKIWGELENTKGLIIDIRNYPSDFPIYDLSAYLMPDSTPFVKFTNGSIEHPGLFTLNQSINVGEKNQDFYKGKVVILINEISQSSAEFHAMAYRVHPNATVIGSTTAGADGNVSPFYLPGGINTMISGIGVYYPDGTETQRIGIVPDIEIKPTIQGIREGRDELMEKAIEIINRP